MNLYDIFDEQKLDQSETFTLEIEDGDVKVSFELARAGAENKKFGTKLNALMKPYKYAMQKGTMKDEQAERILCQALADTVIVDWEGVTDREGNPLEYSAEAAAKLLLELPSLRQLIQDEASDVANFIASERKERAGK
jgi:hypothetical protein